VDAADPPNILILLGDDIDKASLGPWGGQAHTPHIDQLALDGVRLDSVYANVAMCAPFRQEFFSGQCAWRTGAMPNHSNLLLAQKVCPIIYGHLVITLVCWVKNILGQGMHILSTTLVIFQKIVMQMTTPWYVQRHTLKKLFVQRPPSVLLWLRTTAMAIHTW
jgi:hypothetical protein